MEFVFRTGKRPMETNNDAASIELGQHLMMIYLKRGCKIRYGSLTDEIIAGNNNYPGTPTKVL